MPVMVKMYKLTGDPVYLDKLYNWFTYANSIMYDSTEHIYFRDARYVYPKHSTTSGKKDFWARGNGWVFAGLAKVLQDLPVTDVHREEYIQTFRKMAQTLKQYQQPEGYWTRSIIGQGGPREGTLAYDRQRLVDSIGKTVQTAIENYDNEGEAVRLAESARMAVVEASLAGVGVGVGVAIALAVQVVWVDVTGIVAGLAAATLGLLILPMRRRKAKQELEQKLADLRRQLINSLTEQFNREMRRAFQRIDNSIAPFSRFVRAEKDRLTEQEKQLTELESHILSLRAQLEE